MGKFFDYSTKYPSADGYVYGPVLAEYTRTFEIGA